MDPKLYNHQGQILAILDNIIEDSAKIKRVVNGEFTFTFKAFEKELKSEFFEGDTYVVVDGQAFDIAYIEQSHGNSIEYTLECEHVNYRLNDGEVNIVPSFAFTGTPTQILTAILADTEFTVGIVDFTTAMTVTVNNETSKKALVYELANLLGGEVDYRNNGFTIDILNTIGQNRGFQAHFGKNLQGISKVIDKRGTLKTSYRIDLIDLKHSSQYIRADLQDLESVGVGDTITIFDSVINLNVQNRVVSIEYNPIFSINITLEISNQLELITDKIQQIETNSVNAVQQNKLYNHASISVDYGFRSEREDKLARATMGASGLSLDTGDGLGVYTPAMYFDVLKEKYVFRGDIDASGIITGAEIHGGSIEIGYGKFKVDSLGALTATGANISGTISLGAGSTINWASVTPPTAGQVGALPDTTVIPVIPSYIGATQITNAYIASPTIVGGNLDIGSGKFKVDALGVLTATGATISGAISLGAGSVINWGTVTAPTAGQVGALPDSTYIPSVPGYIQATQITNAYIASPEIVGGTLKTVAGSGGYIKMADGDIQSYNAANEKDGFGSYSMSSTISMSLWKAGYRKADYFYDTGTARVWLGSVDTPLKIYAGWGFNKDLSIDAASLYLRSHSGNINFDGHLNLQTPTDHNIVAKFG